MTWPQAPLGELCEVLDSRRKPVTKRDRVAGKFPYYGATGILDYVNEYIFDEKLVLIGEDGAKWGAGEKTAFAAEGKYWVNNHVHVIRPNRHKVMDEWIIYFLNFTDLSKFITGLTVPKLNQGKLCEIPIPLPPLPEQQRIVALLDEAFAGLATATANAEKNLKNARELFESYLNAVFTKRGEGWSGKRLEELGGLQTGTTPKTSEVGNAGDFIPFIKPGDFRADGTLDYENEGLSQKGLQSSRFIPAGSAAMVCIGATIGKSGYVQRDVAANQQINTVTPRRGISAKFLYYQMTTRRFQDAVRANAGQATLPIISKGKWGALTMDVPRSLDEQLAIVSKFDRLLAVSISCSETYRAKLERIAELKQSILQKAFAGELTSSPSRAMKEAAE